MPSQSIFKIKFVYVKNFILGKKDCQTRCDPVNTVL